MMCLSEGVVWASDFESKKNPVRKNNKILRINSKLNKFYYSTGAILMFLQSLQKQTSKIELSLINSPQTNAEMYKASCL